MHQRHLKGQKPETFLGLKACYDAWEEEVHRNHRDQPK